LFAHIYVDSGRAQISAHAQRFDAPSAMQLVDKTPLVKVLHFDGFETKGHITFDCSAPAYMVRCRVFNGAGSKWDVQYSDAGTDGSFKTVGRIELTRYSANPQSPGEFFETGHQSLFSGEYTMVPTRLSG
jgi:hypothetical protein